MPDMTVLQDARYALRWLRKSPGFTAAAILTLALGIGANSAIFSVVDAVMLRPLPVERPEQLVMVFVRDLQGQRDWVSQPDFEDWRSQSQSFQGVASFVPQSVNLTGTEEPTRVIGNFVSSNFFSVLGVSPALGRAFTPGKDRPGAEREVVITYGLWKDRFGGDPSLVGKSLVLNGEPFTVVGILSRSFAFPIAASDVFLPSPYYPNYALNRGQTSCAVFARLRDGVSISEAQAEMSTIAARLGSQYPDANKGRGALVLSMKEILIEDIRPIVLSLFGAVVFVLLIGCTNVANLMLARLMARRRECAVRAALGASSGRLIGQFLTESVLLGSAGGGLGLLLGLWGVFALSKGAAGFLPPGTTLSLDGAVLAFTFALSVGTGVLVGLIPAFQISRTDWNEWLREGRSAGASAARNRSRTLLVVSEVTLALVLLVGSGLMIRSFYELSRVDPGFQPQHVLTMEYRLPRTKYPKPAQQVAFHLEVVERVSALPGVESAASVRALPFSGNGNVADFLLLDRPAPAPNQMPRAQVNAADPGYFRTMRIPLLRGRVFNQHDIAGAPPVVVVNKTLVDRFWPDQDPIGRQLRIPSIDLTATVVGVVGGIKQFGLDDPAIPQIYGSLAQNPFIFTTLVVRTKGDPMKMANEVRKAVWSVDKDQPVWKVRSLESMLTVSKSPRRFVMFMLSGYAALALLLASVGIFGVMSYLVGQRTAEIGIRMALGAQPRHVLGSFLRQGLSMTVVGVVAGVVGALGLTRYLRSQLFAIKATEPSVYAAVAGLLVLVAAAACFIPARRAMKVDPTVALRSE